MPNKAVRGPERASLNARSDRATARGATNLVFQSIRVPKESNGQQKTNLCIRYGLNDHPDSMLNYDKRRTAQGYLKRSCYIHN
eukprot:5056749-Pleurochrysis_carterae.AAC.3